MASRTPQASPKRTSRAKKHSLVKNYLVPHEGNEYHPKLFRMAAVVIFILGIFVFEGVYILDIKLAQDHTTFLASVLPGALLDLTNSDREANGLAPLVNDPELAKAAQLKANDMAANGYFAHVSPSGKTPWYWLEQVGYTYSYAGENLAINFDDSTAVEQAWMNSPTHHANIVKPQYTRVGYAVAQGVYEGKQTTFVVQEFAAKPADQIVTKEVKPQSTVAKAVEKVAHVVQEPATPEPVVSTSSNATQTPEVAGADTNDGQPRVLATQTGGVTSSSGFVAFIKQVAASPTHTSTYVLSALALILALLLIFALISHAKVRYVEVLVGGLIVIAFALSMLVYNEMHALHPVVPSDTNASVQGQ